MKTSLILLMAATLCAQAAQTRFALSPPGTDFAVGLSPSNEVPVVTNSTGSGNTISNGIVFDSSSAILHVAIGYGSAAGFSNLTGPAVAMHIHDAASITQAASVLVSLGSLSVPASNPAMGGFILGDVAFPTNSVSNLMAGLLYINIHTALNPGGEVRAQLIPLVVTNTPPSITCATNTTSECGTATTLAATVSDSDGDALTVVWSVNGTPIQTNAVAGSTNSSSVSFTAILPLGTNSVSVSATDSAGNSASCSTTVTVVDTTPPVIHSISASPNVLWPPNHKMITIHVSADVTDTCGPATWKILSVSSNEAEDAKGSGHTAPDWKITGDHSVQLRAERSGQGMSGRVYTITIQAMDQSGNTSTGTVTVSVPHDRGHGNHGAGNSASQGNSQSNGNQNHGNGKKK